MKRFVMITSGVLVSWSSFGLTFKPDKAVYRFAESFSRANLQHQQLGILRKAAHRFDADLQAHQARVQGIITDYRQQAKKDLAQEKALPPAPPETHNLELERTALLIHHYVTLQATLGSDASAKLDRYLGYEFTPHIKLRRIARSAFREGGSL